MNWTRGGIQGKRPEKSSKPINLTHSELSWPAPNVDI